VIPLGSSQLVCQQGSYRKIKFMLDESWPQLQSAPLTRLKCSSRRANHPKTTCTISVLNGLYIGLESTMVFFTTMHLPTFCGDKLHGRKNCLH
jgi:hypothetical protein